MTVKAPDQKASLLALSIWWIATALWWGLAFYPSSESSPDWLETTRQVCFGTLENGLPDTAGWMILILGPLSFLAALIVTWPGESSQWIRYATKTPKIFPKSVLVFVLSISLIEFVWVFQGVKKGIAISTFDYRNTSDESFPENYPQSKNKAPYFQLVDQFGELQTTDNLLGKTTVLTFAFAHCQTVCPTLVMDCLDAVKEFSNEDVQVFIITLDPWRDTPKSLPQLAKKWELPEKARVLSGSVEKVTETLSNYQVPYARNEKNGDVTHPALVYVINPQGQLTYTFNNAPVDWIKQAVRKLNNAKDTFKDSTATRSHL